jgi:CheY-like chemotaxis protein
MPETDGLSLGAQVAADPQINGVKMMLLTSAGAAALRGRRASMFVATLVKPVKQSELLDAIVTAFAAPARRRRATTPRRSKKPPRALRVLVAEDNPTNQTLILALLEQRGHDVSIVNNGRLAVERATQQPFDVVLMDVQMPEMGGLEATAAIRAAEQKTGGRVPIVALTARAMTGDREQCLAAGMDAYVPKPLRAEELFAVIDALAGSRGATAPSESEPAPAAPPAATGSVDRAALLAGLGGRRDLARRVIDVFLHDAPVMLARLGDAMRASSAPDVAAAAHAIKGSAGLFSQGAAYADARALEMRARDGDLSAAQDACASIERSVSGLMRELEAIRAGL